MNNLLKNPERLAQTIRTLGWVYGILMVLGSFVLLVEKKNWGSGFLSVFVYWAFPLSISYILDLITDVYLKENRAPDATWLIKTLKNGKWALLALDLAYVSAVIDGFYNTSWKAAFGLIIVSVLIWILFEGLAKALEGLEEIRNRMKTGL